MDTCFSDDMYVKYLAAGIKLKWVNNAVFNCIMLSFNTVITAKVKNVYFNRIVNIK